MNEKKIKRVPEEAAIIGFNLRHLRKNARLSQGDIAGLLDISFQQVQKYETGENRFPIEKLFILKHYYGVPYGYFFKGMHTEQAEEADEALYRSLMNMKDHDLRHKIENVVRVLLE